MPTRVFRGEIAKELIKFLMKFKHLMKLARPTLPEPSTTKPTSTRALQTVAKRRTKLIRYQNTCRKKNSRYFFETKLPCQEEKKVKIVATLK